MTPVPLELPVSAADAGRLAQIVFEQAEGRPLRDDVRNRVAARMPRLDSIVPFTRSLAADPMHPSAYYIAVDGTLSGTLTPLLLRIAAASTPVSAMFPNPLLIGRLRLDNGPEIVINAIPFGPADHDRVRRYTEAVDPTVRPRALGARSPFAIAPHDPARVLPAVFAALRGAVRGPIAIAPPAPTLDTIRDTETAALWSAIRAGWREGFALQVDASADTLPAARGYTTFIAPADLHPDIARLKTGAGPWKRFDPDAAIADRTARLTAILDTAATDQIAAALTEFAVP